MIETLIGLSVLLLAGLPLALLFEERCSAGRLAGEAFLFGCGLVTLTMLALSILGVAWSPLSVGLSLAIVVGALAVIAFRRDRTTIIDPSVRASSPMDRVASALIDAGTAAMVAGHAFIATLASIPEIDFWAIWGLKGRIFFERRAIDWKFLEDAGNSFAHPDYPPLVPMTYAFMSLVRGGWEDRWIGLLSTAFAVAAILLVRDLLGRETNSKWMAALGANILAPLALSRWVGTGEPALIAYSAAGLLLIRRGLSTASNRQVTLGAMFLGLAAVAKNEGLALLLAAALGVLVQERGRWQSLLRMWPAAVLAIPWLVLRTKHGVATDFAAVSMIDRAVSGLGRIAAVAEQLALNAPTQPLFWAAALITILVMTTPAGRRERFLVVALGLQALLFVGAYLVTPFDLAWHVAQSWSRILEQLALPLGFLAVVLLLESLNGRRPVISLSEATPP